MLGVLLRMGAHVREAVEEVEHIEPRGVVEVTGSAAKKPRSFREKKCHSSLTSLPVFVHSRPFWRAAKRPSGHAEELRVKENRSHRGGSRTICAPWARKSPKLSDGLEIYGPARLCTERVCRALAIIALPWPLP